MPRKPPAHAEVSRALDALRGTLLLAVDDARSGELAKVALRLETAAARLRQLVDDVQHDRCIECGRVWVDDDEPWRRYLTADDETTLYCPACAEREFDDNQEGHDG